MEIDLENLSKQELLALIKKHSKTISKQEKAISKQEHKTSVLEEKNTELERLVKLLQRMKFGQSRERFEDPDQMELPFEVKQITKEVQEETIKQEITYSREKKKHPGRAKLPDNLPVEVVEIYPEGDFSDMMCIGKEITEVLDYVPSYFRIIEYIRYKYATKDKDNTQISIGLLPERIIDWIFHSILHHESVKVYHLFRQSAPLIPTKYTTYSGKVHQ
ncbi:IS66 family transposase zinc-finger binding domain-containing protein [Myroides sp. N17-2]|uniref:IS66 family transposase n=1 Tax=Myroides sp. N17-2 TaxID=2030799 RepID=UPI0020B15C8D|nr:IS66 family transposase zinc-finger binding domain-containing protein [Myroides sp. N17-2]